MAEQTGAALSQLPVLLVRPERGNFLADKSGGYARLGVVQRDFTAADQAQRLRTWKRIMKTVRLDGDDKLARNAIVQNNSFNLASLKW